MDMVIVTQRSEHLKRKSGVFPRKTSSPTGFCFTISLSKSQRYSLLDTVHPSTLCLGSEQSRLFVPAEVTMWPHIHVRAILVA